MPHEYSAARIFSGGIGWHLRVACRRLRSRARWCRLLSKFAGRAGWHFCWCGTRLLCHALGSLTDLSARARHPRTLSPQCNLSLAFCCGGLCNSPRATPSFSSVGGNLPKCGALPIGCKPNLVVLAQARIGSAVAANLGGSNGCLFYSAMVVASRRCQCRITGCSSRTDSIRLPLRGQCCVPDSVNVRCHE
jgi:hypothetical protein